jgi:hypothetical protein
MWAAHRQTHRLLFSQQVRMISSKSKSSTSGSNPYPYPTHANPSPFQIFHLPHNASQAEIKRRCTPSLLVRLSTWLIQISDIDLVRIYHPDSPVSRALPSEITDGRFQSITKAYGTLRGKTAMNPGGIDSKPDDQNPVPAWRLRQARRLDLDTGGDDRWKDRIILFGVIFVRNMFIY